MLPHDGVGSVSMNVSHRVIDTNACMTLWQLSNSGLAARSRAVCRTYLKIEILMKVL